MCSWAILQQPKTSVLTTGVLSNSPGCPRHSAKPVGVAQHAKPRTRKARSHDLSMFGGLLSLVRSAQRVQRYSCVMPRESLRRLQAAEVKELALEAERTGTGGRCACGLQKAVGWESVPDERWPSQLMELQGTLRDPSIDEPTSKNSTRPVRATTRRRHRLPSHTFHLTGATSIVVRPACCQSFATPSLAATTSTIVRAA